MADVCAHDHVQAHAHTKVLTRTSACTGMHARARTHSRGNDKFNVFSHAAFLEVDSASSFAHFCFQGKDGVSGPQGQPGTKVRHDEDL